MLKIKHFVFTCFLLTIITGGALLKVEAQKNADDKLIPYSSCIFDDSLIIKNSRRINDVKSRAVKTAQGDKEVSRINSYEISATYPKTDDFASIRPEQSQSKSYQQDKKNVIENLKYTISTTQGLELNEPIKASYNGFESYGLNRTTVEANSTVGIYVLFNDADKTITTIYFFNADPKKRNFQTIEEWRKLKDKFLNSYTRCVNTNSKR